MNFIKKYKKLIFFLIICLIIFLIFKYNNHHNISYIALGDGFALGKNSYGQIDYGYSDHVKDYIDKNNKLNKYIKTFSEEDASINTIYQLAFPFWKCYLFFCFFKYINSIICINR